MSEPDGFVVTALTGGALLAAAVIFGLVLVSLSSLIHQPHRSGEQPGSAAGSREEGRAATRGTRFLIPPYVES
jgi:hypothetical protein